MDEHTFTLGNKTWKVKDLWKAAEGLEPFEMELQYFEPEKIINSRTWTQEGSLFRALTIREILAHARRVTMANLAYPILLTPDWDVADGIHRIVKASEKGHRMIRCVKLEKMPPTRKKKK